MYNFRTDLADERSDLYKKANKLQEIEGVKASEEQFNDHIKKTKVEILDENGENALRKPKGVYVTIDINNLKIAQDQEIEDAASCLSQELKELINKHIDDKSEILVVGLGNEYVTPDALGPKVIADIDVTRHILQYMPQYLDKDTRAVSAISPGVLGTTGIETVEILKGIVQNVKPKLLIVIDALASRNIDRISKTVQLSDTGIVPGAGVGNKRNEISVNSLGTPVIAIGVPTVVDLATITDDCLDIFIGKLQEKGESNAYLNKLKEDDNYEGIKEALNPNDYNMIVTPKEIDDLIVNMSSVVARGINMSLQ